MAIERDPWAIPEWHAIRRECALARHLLGSGATALSRANYADRKGEYYTAFFGLSVGLERLAKLILVADHAIANAGRMPEQQVVRRFGHKLADLMDAAEKVSANHALKLDHPRPTDAISRKVVECLDAFADAGRGRYANFAALGDPNLGQDDPIGKWWGEVAELILKDHYFGKPVQTRVEGRATVVDAAMSPISRVVYFGETGEVMQDVLAASIRTGQTELVQRHGRYYALTVVRWLSRVFSKISHSACYTHNVDAFFGVWEYLQTYTVDDSLLKTRKNWPLT
jgi:hypothetical protein